MPHLPLPLDTRLGRTIARRRFPDALSSDQAFPPADPLSDEERRFFATKGYLVRRDVIPADLLKPARDFAWSLLPPRFERHAPASWRGRVKDALGHSSLRRRRGRLAFREPLRDQAWLLQLLANNRAVLAAAGGLIGADRLVKPDRVRCLEMVFPASGGCRRYPRPRTDGRPFLLGVTAYLDRVEEGAGGFMLWPASHLAMRWAYHHAAGPGRANDYHRRLYQLASGGPAVEITGEPGTVIFWHHRLAHCAAPNTGSAPRISLTTDFSTHRMPQLLRQPAPLDPWREWAISGGVKL